MHKKLSNNWLESEQRLIFETASPAETPDAGATERPEEAKPEATGERAAAEAEQARETRKAADREQVKDGLGSEVHLRFANLTAYDHLKDTAGKTLRERFEIRFNSTTEKFNAALTAWLQKNNKTFQEVLSKEGKIAEIVEKRHGNPAEITDDLVLFIAHDIAGLFPKGKMPSEINVNEAVQAYLSVYDKNLEPAAREELKAIYTSYLTDLNKAIQSAKKEIKFSKLTDEEKKLYEKYKNLENIPEAQAAEQLKDVPEAEREKILKVLKTMRGAEKEAETVAQELKEGGFIASLMKLVEEIMKQIEKILGKLGIKKAEEKAPETGPERAKVSPLGGNTVLSITSWPGDREPITAPDGSKSGDKHFGFDFRVAEGTPFMAVDDGEIVRSEVFGSYGLVADLKLASGTIIRYAHLSSAESVGVKVKAGEVIGKSGGTLRTTEKPNPNAGTSTAAHGHIEVWKNGKVADPLKYFRGIYRAADDFKKPEPDEASRTKFFEGNQPAIAKTAQKAEAKAA